MSSSSNYSCSEESGTNVLSNSTPQHKKRECDVDSSSMDSVSKKTKTEDKNEKETTQPIEQFKFTNKNDKLIDIDLLEKSKTNVNTQRGIQDSLENHNHMIIENETSFSFVISKNLRDKLFTLFKVDTKRATHIIFHYSHGDKRHDRRSVNNTFQLKKIKNYNKYVNGLKFLYIAEKDTIHTIPITFTRKEAEEYTDKIHDDFTKVVSITHRYVLYIHKTIRLAVEYKDGLYHLTGEIEYSNELLTNYKKLIETEEELWMTFKAAIQRCGLQCCKENFIIYNNISQQVLALVPGRKFSKFKDAQFSYLYCKIMYKFNGYRGILFIGNGYYLYSDAMGNNHKIYMDLSPYLLVGTMFQLEIMEEEKLIVITDVLGVMCKNNQYMPDPLEAIIYLMYTKINKKQLYLEFIKHGTTTTYTLKTQQFININKLSLEGKIHTEHFHIFGDGCRVDGYILITSNKIYKFKQPTVDVEIRDGEMFAAKHEKTIAKRTYSLENAVYEIQPHPDDFCDTYKQFKDPIILRVRHDRSCGNSLTSISECLRDASFLSKIAKQNEDGVNV